MQTRSTKVVALFDILGTKDRMKTIGIDGVLGREAAGFNVRVHQAKEAMDVTLPANVLRGSGNLSLSWIDAYRRDAAAMCAEPGNAAGRGGTRLFQRHSSLGPRGC